MNYSISLFERAVSFTIHEEFLFTILFSSISHSFVTSPTMNFLPQTIPQNNRQESNVYYVQLVMLTPSSMVQRWKDLKNTWDMQLAVHSGSLYKRNLMDTWLWNVFHHKDRIIIFLKNKQQKNFQIRTTVIRNYIYIYIYTYKD